MSTKICIAVPTRGTVTSRTALSLMNTMKLSYDIFPVFDYSNDIWSSREKLVDIASQFLCSHIFFVDGDMEFPSETLQKLIEADKDIVGCDYNFKYLPLTAIAEPLTEKTDGLYQVKGMGFGCVLIKMSVFEKLSRPCFIYPSDDFSFCGKAREVGFEVWVDGSINIKHLGEFAY